MDMLKAIRVQIRFAQELRGRSDRCYRGMIARLRDELRAEERRKAKKAKGE